MRTWTLKIFRSRTRKWTFQKIADTDMTRTRVSTDLWLTLNDQDGLKSNCPVYLKQTLFNNGPHFWTKTKTGSSFEHKVDELFGCLSFVSFQIRRLSYFQVVNPTCSKRKLQLSGRIKSDLFRFSPISPISDYQRLLEENWNLVTVMLNLKRLKCNKPRSTWFKEISIIAFNDSIFRLYHIAFQMQYVT